jgi:hypothetical protein
MLRNVTRSSHFTSDGAPIDTAMKLRARYKSGNNFRILLASASRGAISCLVLFSRREQIPNGGDVVVMLWTPIREVLGSIFY